MKASEKAALLIQRAQDKGRAGFEQWKEGYLSEKLMHRNAQEARAFLREKYNDLIDWDLKHRDPKNLFDLNATQEQLARGWAACFQDWKDGLKPFPGTPDYDDTAEDSEGNPLGPYIPPSWLSALAERYKVRFILGYIDEVLNDKLEIWQRQKFNRIAFAARLAVRLVLEAGALPEKAILDALKQAQDKDGKAGALPEEALRQMANTLLEECRGARSEDELAYLQKQIDAILGHKPQKQEATTKIWALYYWYLWQAGLMPELHSGSGKKEALNNLGKKHGISGHNLLQVFNAVKRNSDKNPFKEAILEEVLPMLAEHPEAYKKAKADLEKLQKYKQG
jgi:hypothetical protein